MKWLSRFASSPYTELFIGVVMSISAGAEIWQELSEGLKSGEVLRLGAHHGMIFLGVWQIIKVLPHTNSLLNTDKICYPSL